MQGKGCHSSLTAPLQSLQLSTSPLAQGYLGELVVWRNPYLAANSWKDNALEQGPLSEITISGIPWVENSSLAAVITLFAVCVVRSLISTHLE